MVKLINYEVKKSKIILLVLMIVMFLSVFMMTAGAFIMSFFILVYIIGLFAYAVKSIIDDLDKDSGYLTFSLPLRGREVIKSKVIVYTAYMCILLLTLALSLLFFFYLAYRRGNSTAYLDIVLMVRKIGISRVIGFTIILVIEQVLAILLMFTSVYLAIGLVKWLQMIRKSPDKDRGLGSWWLILWFLINLSINKISDLLVGILPKMELVILDEGVRVMTLLTDFKKTWNDGTEALLSIDFIEIIISIVFIVAIVNFVGYLLDEKIELA